MRSVIKQPRDIARETGTRGRGGRGGRGRGEEEEEGEEGGEKRKRREREGGEMRKRREKRERRRGRGGRKGRRGGRGGRRGRGEERRKRREKRGEEGRRTERQTKRAQRHTNNDCFVVRRGFVSKYREGVRGKLVGNTERVTHRTHMKKRSMNGENKISQALQEIRMFFFSGEQHTYYSSMRKRSTNLLRESER